MENEVFSKIIAKTFARFAKNHYLCTRNSEIQQTLKKLNYLHFG